MIVFLGSSRFVCPSRLSAHENGQPFQVTHNSLAWHLFDFDSLRQQPALQAAWQQGNSPLPKAAIDAGFPHRMVTAAGR
jgi:hypothetical protein